LLWATGRGTRPAYYRGRAPNCGGDPSAFEIIEEAFDRIGATNLRGFAIAAKQTLPITRKQWSGVILSIPPVAALSACHKTVAYKTTKAGTIAFTEQIARQNAEYGIRCNVPLPGLMHTPMAADTPARCRPRLPVPRLQRGQLHHRRDAACRRQRTAANERLMVARGIDDPSALSTGRVPRPCGAWLRHDTRRRSCRRRAPHYGARWAKRRSAILQPSMRNPV
jgi:NAD(P)-dependent dehydrogenase (short-subunit alcohol dehydrogenase family)